VIVQKEQRNAIAHLRVGDWWLAPGLPMRRDDSTKDETAAATSRCSNRYEGSFIVNYETKAYDELTCP